MATGRYFTTVDPFKDGLYLLWKCSDEMCIVRNAEVYAFVGAEGRFNLLLEAEKASCSWCRGGKGQLLGILVHARTWSFQGHLDTGEYREMDRISSDCEIILLAEESWVDLHVTVAALPNLKREREPSEHHEFFDASFVLSVEEVREDVRRKQEIIDILKGEMKAKEKEKRALVQSIQRMREEVEKLKRKD